MLIVMGCMLLITACTSIDCPLNNHVYTYYQVAGEEALFAGPLTISTNRSDGSDSICINQDTYISKFGLPISYQGTFDTFYFVYDIDESIVDTVVVEKTDQPHFESIECNPIFFHTIKDIQYTKNMIDSITIKDTQVTYDTTKVHFNIYFKNSNH
jgi:hypothetical protein